MIDLSRAIRCVNFDAGVSMFLVSGILPVDCFVETSCVIRLCRSVELAAIKGGIDCGELTHICMIMSAVKMPHVKCIPFKQ
jgi:hypothetical protein